MHATPRLTAFIDSIAKLDDDELIANTQRLLRDERKLSARLLAHLAEVDTRQLYRPLGHSSMFDYCVHALHFSESEAYLRIHVARTARRFPHVLRMLAAGELHLSGLKLLAPVLDDANCDELLATARFKTKRDIELLLANRQARPDVPSLIRKLPQPASARPAPAPSPQIDLLAAASNAESQHPENAANAAAPAHPPASTAPTAVPPAQSPMVHPLGADRYKVQLTASKQLHDKLRQARDLLRHELPSGDLAQVLEQALDLLIADRMKRRFAQTTKPRAPRTHTAPKPNSRHIPNEVRRKVLERDGTRCTFVTPDGKRCEERAWLELHHEHPHARGGPPTLDNIRMLCASHNRLLAERDYGRAFVQKRIDKARAGTCHNEPDTFSSTQESTTIRLGGQIISAPQMPPSIGPAPQARRRILGIRTPKSETI